MTSSSPEVISRDIFEEDSHQFETVFNESSFLGDMSFKSSHATDYTIHLRGGRPVGSWADNQQDFFRDQLDLFDTIAKLKQVILEKEETIATLRSELAKVNMPVKIVASKDIQTDLLPSPLVSTASVEAQTELPFDFSSLPLILKLQNKVDELESKFRDWEEGSLHELFVRVFKSPSSSSPAPGPPHIDGLSDSTAVHPQPNPATSMGLGLSSVHNLPPVHSSTSKGVASQVSPRPVQRSSASVSKQHVQSRHSPLNCRSPKPVRRSSASVSKQHVQSRHSPLNRRSPPSNNVAPNLGTNKNNPMLPNKSILLLGDSIIKHVNLSSLHKVCLRGGDVRNFINHLPSLSLSYDTLLIHCGTNSLKVNDLGFISNSEDVLRDFNDLFFSLKTRFPSSKICISGVIFRRDINLNSVICVNNCISDLCQSYDFTFIDPNSWVYDDCLGRDGLHLNRFGTQQLSHFFKSSLN